MSEKDGVPVLLMHLPEWEQRRESARFMTNAAELNNAVGGDRKVLSSVDFLPGTEAVTATYDAGKLVIIEHASPAVSAENDQKLEEAIYNAGDGKTFHKRIGNYNVIMFDAPNRTAAEALIDQVKYEKHVQWLGRNPFEVSVAERNFVLTTSNIFMSTLMVIVGGIVFSIIAGLAVGWFFFGLRRRQSATYTTHTDGGGMTRLNLDGFTPDVVPERLLGK